MGTIMGMGSSHWPAMIQPDEAKPWPFLRTLAHDPRVPEELKNPLNWPEGVRTEIEAFNPDFILMFGDDQYENFKEDVIPPFCVLAYGDLTSYPFKEGRR